MYTKNLTLKNGFTIKYCAMPNTHSVTLALRINGGMAQESNSQNGITHLVEHLCFRRCAGKAQADFYYLAESIGAYLRGITYRECLVFEITVNPKYVHEAAIILQSLFAENYWTHEDFRREKEVVYRQIEGSGNYCYNRMIYDFFEQRAHGSSIAGTKNKIKRISLLQAEMWKSKLFCPSSAVLAVAGCAAESALQDITAVFSEISGAEATPLTNIKPESFLKRGFLNDRMYTEDVNYLQVCLAFDINPDIAALPSLEILKTYMCGQMLSPLSMRLREELGLLHETISDIERFSFGGLWYFIFDVHKSGAQQLLNEITSIFCEQKQCLNSAVVNCAKETLTCGMSYIYDNTVESAYMLLENDGEGCIDDYFKKIKATGLSEVQTLAQNIFCAENLSLTLYNVPNDKGLQRKLSLQAELFRNRLAE